MINAKFTPFIIRFMARKLKSSNDFQMMLFYIRVYQFNIFFKFFPLTKDRLLIIKVIFESLNSMIAEK
ncbi:Uncharacterised protein [Mycobacteroides abscessus subsp. abscessus]|nr:Uncharacterised protein [Mycobacteroides abscessus subsp. abscessus]